MPSEGILRISNEYEFGFGIKTFMITQTIGIDYSIVFSPMLGFKADGYISMSEMSQKRYGFGFDTVIISPYKVDYKESRSIKDFGYLKVTCSEAEKEINFLKHKIKRDKEI